MRTPPIASLDRPFVPAELSKPFGDFPNEEESTSPKKVKFSSQQAVENTQAGKKYKSIFLSNTVL